LGGGKTGKVRGNQDWKGAMRKGGGEGKKRT